jgi:hypothetical protein
MADVNVLSRNSPGHVLKTTSNLCIADNLNEIRRD